MEEDIVVVNKKRKGLFLLDSKTSRILFIWNFVIFAIFSIDIFCTPLAIVWTDNLARLLPVFKVCNAAWLINIVVRCITIREGQEIIDSRSVFLSYLKSALLIDVLATIPLILANNNHHILFLRLLHIFDIKLA